MRTKIPNHELNQASEEGLNIYKCDLSKDKSLMTFFCPVCHTDHTHGRAGLGPFEITHRSAHCARYRLDQSDPQEQPNYVSQYYIFHTDRTVDEDTVAV